MSISIIHLFEFVQIDTDQWMYTVRDFGHLPHLSWNMIRQPSGYKTGEGIRLRHDPWSLCFPAMNQQNTQQQREQCHTDRQNNRNGNARISINKGKEGRIPPITAVLEEQWNPAVQRKYTPVPCIDNAEQSLDRHWSDRPKEAAPSWQWALWEDKLRYFTRESR